MKVFISWSRERSKSVARAWAKLLPGILQNVEVFFSEDIDAGELWGTRLDTELANTHHGILCLTSENKTAPWIMYEAGALSKQIGKARVCCYLHELTIADVGYPLARFNLVTGDKAGAFKIVNSVNNALELQALKFDRLQRTFEKFYPDFEAELKAVPPTETPAPQRSDNELLQELLQLVRGQSQQDGYDVATLRKRLQEKQARLGEPKRIPSNNLRITLKEAATFDELMDGLHQLRHLYHIFELPTDRLEQAMAQLTEVGSDDEFHACKVSATQLASNPQLLHAIQELGNPPRHDLG